MQKKHTNTHKTNPTWTVLNEKKKDSFYNEKMTNRKKYPFLEVKIV